MWCAAGLAGLCSLHYMLRAEQASLTGEPQAVLKGTDAVADANCELQVIYVCFVLCGVLHSLQEVPFGALWQQ